ncbi:DUF947-domain-containing protein [Phlegmacium glaucopus]|nr:DUF947-domain-containing protein [Phlegmacium glaucopus]
MPRRPRPAHRVPPGQVNHRAPPKAKIVPKVHRQFHEPESKDSKVAYEEESSFSEEFKEGSGEEDRPSAQNALKRKREEEDEDKDEDEDEDEEVDEETDVDIDADTPRVVQWLDDDDILPGQSWEDELRQKAPDEEMLEADLKDLPLGALLRARRAFTEAETDSAADSDTNSGSDSDLERTVEEVKGKGKEKVEWNIKPRKDIPKRAHKNAPIEVTSKRPVTRKRTVVEVPKIVPRDPRFLATAGEFSPEKFSKSYSFLTDKHKMELATLRETLKQARKLLASSPRDLRNEREDEVYRLEQAIKRAESTVNKDRLDQVERDALGKAKKEEVEKRQQGKGKWFLKKADRQQLVTKARYEALAKEGGTRAVKKAILRKQKKVSQSEKRSRPYKKQKSVGE